MPVLYNVQVRTHTGGVRDVNEDAVSTVLDWRGPLGLSDADLQARGHLFAVADGMGGHAAGEVASRLAIETLFRHYYQGTAAAEPALAAAIATINEALCAQAAAQQAFAGLGTTLVAALLHGDALTLANVGDSRAYLYRGGELTQITRDHSWVAEQVAAGVLTAEEAARHPYRNVITHSLGPDRDPSPEFFHLTLQKGDLLLLCSDGLSNLVSDQELAAFLAAYQPDEAADVLLQYTLERGAPDNVTLALLAFQGEPVPRPRRAWPWVLAAFLLVAALAFLLRRPLLQLLPGPAGLIATARPTPLPLLTPSPPPTATLLPPLPPPPAGELLQVREIAAGVPPPALADPGMADSADCFAMLRPLPDCFVFVVRGALDPAPAAGPVWSAVLRHAAADGAIHAYRFTVREGVAAAALPPPRGSIVTLVARPVDENASGPEVGVQPLLLLDEQGSLLWAHESPEGWLSPQGALWVYTLAGPGGSDALGAPPRAAAAGEPILLFGHWLQATENEAVWQFQPLVAPPYELGEDAVFAPK